VLVVSILFFCLLVLAWVRRLLSGEEDAGEGSRHGEGAADVDESGGLLAYGGSSGEPHALPVGAAGVSVSPLGSTTRVSFGGHVRPLSGRVVLDVLTDEEAEAERERADSRAPAGTSPPHRDVPLGASLARGMSLKGGAARTARGNTKKAKIGLGAKPLDESD